MIPVVMLVIDTGASSPVFLTLSCLTMAHPSYEHIPVIYLTTVALTAIVLSLQVGGRTPVFLSSMLDGTQIVHLMLSLFINIFATSIIALKAWCVCVDRVIGELRLQLVDNTMTPTHRRYRKLLMDLYSNWCKFRLGVHAMFVAISLFSSGHELGLYPHIPALRTWEIFLTHSCP